MDPSSFGGSEASPPPEPEISPVSGFLKDIPDQDRPIVEKYVKNWDAGVTKRFQSIHDEYKGKLKPYEELGSPESLQQILQFVNRVNNDPAAAYKAMQQIIQSQYPEIWEELNDAGEEMEQEYEEQEYEDYGGLDPAIQQMMEQQNQRIEELNYRWEQQQQSEIESQQFEAFDRMLDDVLQRAGIDSNDENARDWITIQLAREVPIDQAVKAYHSFVNGLRNSQPNIPVPNIIGGQGGVPTDQVDVSKLRGSSRRDLVEGLLKASQQG